MTEPASFLKRWSKRKLAQREQSAPERNASEQPAADERRPARVPTDAGEAAASKDAATSKNESFDLASFPPLELMAVVAAPNYLAGKPLIESPDDLLPMEGKSYFAARSRDSRLSCCQLRKERSRATL